MTSGAPKRDKSDAFHYDGTVMAWLKVDFHTHTAEDPKDRIAYGARRLIDRAAELGYDALALTNHFEVSSTPELESYAGRRGILLLPGAELTLARKHVVVINPPLRRYPRNGSLDDLPGLAGPDRLVIAPHPFHHGFRSLQKKTLEHLDRFDALEFSSFYNHLVNMSRTTRAVAERAGKPLVGSSDCHNIWQFGTTWSEVDAEKDLGALVRAVKAGRVRVRTTPLSLWTMFRVGMNFILTDRLKLNVRI